MSIAKLDTIESKCGADCGLEAQDVFIYERRSAGSNTRLGKAFMSRLARWKLRNRGLCLEHWLLTLLIAMSPAVLVAQISAKDSLGSPNAYRSAVIEAWRIEMDYVRTNQPNHINGRLVGSGGGEMGSILIRKPLSNIDVDAFSCTLVHPIDTGGDGWSAFVNDKHSWSMSDVLLSGLSYPIIGIVKTSSDNVFTIVPAVFKAKVDIEAGAVRQIGGYLIESKRGIKAGESFSVLLVNGNILSVETDDSVGQVGQSQPWLIVLLAQDALMQQPAASKRPSAPAFEADSLRADLHPGAADSLLVDAQRMTDALHTKDYNSFARCMPSRLIEALGGVDSFVRDWNREILQMGIKSWNATVGTPSKMTKVGGELLATLSQHSVISLRDGRLEMPSTLICFSEDNGLHWTFVDTSDGQLMDQLNKTFPGLSDRLDFSKTQMGVLQKN